MAIPSWNRVHLPYVATCSQVHRLWSIVKNKKHPEQDVMSRNYIMKRFFLITSLILFASLADAPRVFASILQSDSGTVLEADNLFVAQTLGTGLTGTVNAIYLMAGNSGNFNNFSLYLVQYNDNTYATPVIQCQITEGGDYSSVEDGDLIYFAPVCGGETDEDETLTFDPTKYYAIINNNYNYPFQKWRGSSSNTYANGEACFPSSITNNSVGNGTGGMLNCVGDAPIGGVSDLYFQINTEGSGIITNETRFISVIPVASSTVATTTTIGASLYIKPSDYKEGMYLQMSFTNQSVSLLGGSVLDAWNSASGQGREIRLPLSSGSNNVSTTTTFITAGKNTGIYKIVSPTFTSSIPILGVLFSPSIVLSTSTYFFVGQKTSFDSAVELGGESLTEYILTGTTTGANTITNCANIATSGIVPCLVSLVVPSSQTLTDDITRLRNGFLSSWPLGYITRIITILTASTTASLPVLSATVPNGVVGAGAHITLDLNHSLDYILYSNVGSFANESASSTDTFFNITNYYWKIMVYLAVAFYIMRRIMGSHIVPHFHPHGNKEIS